MNYFALDTKINIVEFYLFCIYNQPPVQKIKGNLYLKIDGTLMGFKSSEVYPDPMILHMKKSIWVRPLTYKILLFKSLSSKKIFRVFRDHNFAESFYSIY